LAASFRFIFFCRFWTRHRSDDFIERVGWFIRADFPSGFLEPLGLSLVTNLRLSLLLLTCFSHGDAQ